MEGNQVTLFVTCLNQEAVITLSEYDTVEQLKIEIHARWDIPVEHQQITGWHNIPSSDDIILQICCRSDTINCLEVEIACGASSTTETTPDDSKSSYDMEIAAIISLKQKLISDIPIRELTLSNAISIVGDSAHKKRALLIYLHNSEDQFSQEFLSSVQDKEIEYILKETCIMIGWDMDDSTYNNAVLSAVGSYSELSFVPGWISRRLGGLICLFPTDSGLTVFFALNRFNHSCNILKQYLRMIQSEYVESDEFNDASEYPSNNFAEKEIEAAESLRRKLPSHIAATFKVCSLDDAIEAICSPQLDERKALLLYLHNSNQPFSQMFIDNLPTGELPTILNRSFLVLGWNVEDSEYHDALDRALSRHVNLTIVADLVRNKVAVALCILPVNDTISVFLCLRGKVSLKDSIKNLRNAEEVFKIELEKEEELRKLEAERKQSNLNLNAEKLQSIWADMLGDRDYDSFEFDEHEYLKQKISFGLKGAPKKESGYTELEQKEVDLLFGVIKEQSQLFTEYKGQIEMACIFNCLVPLAKEKLNRAKKFPDYIPNDDITPVPVFILRKCRDSINCCRIFIDDSGRVYENWQDYLTKNKYPECEMIVPLNGRYQVINDKVLLEKHLSPACHLDTKLLQVGDIVSTVAGLASGAVFVTATVASIAAMPIVAPSVMIGATVAGAASGAWAIGRSIHSLFDKNKHKESISFANSQARAAYLNIVAGTLGFVGAGANITLTQCVQNGINIGKTATYTVNTIGALNISAGGVSLINSGYEVIDQWITRKEAPSTLTMLQLGSSVLFFGHAVYNFKPAQTIVDETQARVLQDYQESLRSNRHRKTFDRLMRETMKSQGDGVRGKAEVISAIRNIPNKDEVFAALTRNTKALNKAGVRYSAEGGKITFGGMEVDMNKFIGFNKQETEIYLSSLGQDPVGQQPTSSLNFNNSSSIKNIIDKVGNDIKIDISSVSKIDLIYMASKLLLFCDDNIKTKVILAVQQGINYIFTKMSKHLVDEIDAVIPKDTQFCEYLRIVISFFSEKVDAWEKQYRLYEETKNKKHYDSLFETINPLYAKRVVQFFEHVVTKSFLGQSLTFTVLDELSKYLVTSIAKIIVESTESKEKKKKRDVHSAGFKPKKVHCSICGGYYFQHQI